MIPGFGVRVFPSGKKSYVLSYRHESKKRLITVGQCNRITLTEARQKAKRLLGDLAKDIDPLSKRQESKKKQTVEAVFQDYMEKYAKAKNKSWQQTQRIFEHDILPIIGRKYVQGITKSDVIRVIDKIGSRGAQTLANRALAHMSRFFNWCHERDFVSTPPTLNLSKPYAPPVYDMLMNVPRQNPYIFSIDGTKPFNGAGRAKRRLDACVTELRVQDGLDPMPHWRIHDLRRTAASGMAQLGVMPHVIERVLNHSSGVVSGVAAVYNRYNYADEVRDALEKWSKRLVLLTGEDDWCQL